jgi:hypothetical protein
MNGYGDELCARIGRTVISAEEPQTCITLSLGDDSSMSLRDEDMLRPEALLFSTGVSAGGVRDGDAKTGRSARGG